MVSHDYECGHCGHRDTEYHRMGHAPDVTNCPKCGMALYKKQVSAPHTDMKEYWRPIEMYSIAANSDEEIRQLKRDVPGLQISEDRSDPMYGVPIAKNYSEKKKALQSTGFVDASRK